jgi:putative transposase
MARPSRKSDPSNIRADSRTFFVTSKTAQGRALLQSDRMASLFIDVLRSYTAAKRFIVHEFIVMPNHFTCS